MEGTKHGGALEEGGESENDKIDQYYDALKGL